MADRKPRQDPAVQRALILDTTQSLMVEEGYAAVSTRRVAKEAGLTSALVHYYYPTTDDLLLDLYRRAHAVHLERLTHALLSLRPLRALWELNRDRLHAAFGVELLAMANHRKVIGKEIVRHTKEVRMIQSAAIARILAAVDADIPDLPAQAIAMAMSGISHAMSTEAALTVSIGHRELEAYVLGLIDAIEDRREQSQSAGNR